MELSLGQAQITLLPGAQAAYEESNDYSIFLELLYGQTSFLFAGDAEETRLAEYLASPDLRRFDVLKVPHHGRACAQSEAFFTSVPTTASWSSSSPWAQRSTERSTARSSSPRTAFRSPSPEAPQFSRS